MWSGRLSIRGGGRTSTGSSRRTRSATYSGYLSVLVNLETVLGEAGFTLSDVMRLNYYTTDVDQFFGVYDILTSRLAKAGCRPATMLVGVERLAYPEMLIEIEATAVA